MSAYPHYVLIVYRYRKDKKSNRIHSLEQLNLKFILISLRFSLKIAG